MDLKCKGSDAGYSYMSKKSHKVPPLSKESEGIQSNNKKRNCALILLWSMLRTNLSISY